jgi:hypothetical protein
VELDGTTDIELLANAINVDFSRIKINQKEICLDIDILDYDDGYALWKRRDVILQYAKAVGLPTCLRLWWDEGIFGQSSLDIDDVNIDLATV